jgi:hypothetical protein
MLALDRGKGCLDAPVGQPKARHDMLGVGASDDLQLGVAIHIRVSKADEAVSRR